MRNTVPLLARRISSPALMSNNNAKPIPQINTVSTARLGSATSSADQSTPDAPSSPSLAPNLQPRKRLVLKKSRPALSAAGREKDKENERKEETSEVARRAAVPSEKHAGRNLYVDDPDIGEIVVVKRRKSRAALNGLE